LDVLNDPVLASDEDGRIHYVNAAAERLLGWPAHELIGKPLTTIMPPRLRAAHEAGFRRYMTTHRARIIGRPIRVPALHRDGFEIEVELTLSALPGPGGTPVIAVLRDLRERVGLERKIAAQRKILAQYAAVSILAEADTAAEAMPKILEATARALQWDLAIYWALNPGAQRLAVSATWSSGTEEADLFLESCMPLTFGPGEALPGTVLSSGEAEWSRELATDPRYGRAPLATALGLRSALLFPVLCANRTWGVLEYVSSHVEELDEELRQTMKALGFQIGQFLERLEKEKDLRRAWAQAEVERKNLRQLFEDAPAAIAIVRGEEMRYELSNAINQELGGGRPQIGKTLTEALPALEAAGVVAAVRRVYETGEPFIAREYLVTIPETPRRPSRSLFMNGVMQPLRGAQGEIEGVMIFAYEVTDLVASRERVKEAEERLRLAVESADVGTWDFDPRTSALTADARYRRLYGLGPDAEISLEIVMRAIHPDDRQQVEDALRRSMDPSMGGEFASQYRTRGIEDGLERWIAMRGRVIFDEGDRPVRLAGTGVDATSEKKALDRLRFLAAASNVLSSSLDERATLADVVRLAVPRLADLCVVELTTEEGEAEKSAVAAVDSAKAERVRELRRRYPPRRSSVSPFGNVFVTGQANLVPTLTDELLAENAHDEAHLKLLRELDLRSMIVVPLKARERTIAVLGLYQSESGRKFTPEDLGFAEEVARRAAAAVENARLYERATRAVGVRDQFLSIASHELKTPLTALVLHLSALTRLVAGGRLASVPVEKLAKRFELMDQQASRLTALVDELLDVSRMSSGRLELDREPMDLVALVREVAARLGPVAARAGAFIEITAERPIVGAWDRSRLDQVVTNLVGNAVKYAPGGPVAIDASRRDGYAVVAVRDRGPGIPEGDQKRIFEQFERAAPPTAGGLGLGLWIANRIVEAHGGRIEVDSRPGEGATFAVHLPLGAAP
jgi:PAS domain S-box-containing protein